MEQFVWDSFFETGLANIDQQHHDLVDLINRFGNLLLRPQNVDADEIVRVLGELANYARRHFNEEEQLMTSLALDPRHVQAHVVSHADFLREVERQSAGLPGLAAVAARALHEFLVNWLTFHVLGVDQLMARQIAAIRGGASSKAAFGSVVGAQDPATATLVRSMDRLFQQISERNRELFELNQSLEERVEQRTQELSEANLRLQGLALTDTLTSLANRRAAMRKLHAEWDAGESNERPLACIMIDVDGFKDINDRHGHDAGDEVLRSLARALDEAVRTDDTLCRLGGDEFLVVCSRTPLPGAMQLAEDLRQKVNGMCVPAGAGQWRGSISAGVAVRGPGMSGPDDLLKAADQGLYAAKRSGRDRVATTCGAP
jgi:hemerythrin